MSDCIIIGGGIAGLTMAYRLSQRGLSVILLEADNRVGGCIQTCQEDGCLLELGPNTLLSSNEALWDLASDLSLNEEKIEADDSVAKERYIFKNSRLIPVPSGPKILFSPILSLLGRLRLLCEPFVKASTVEDESLADFVRRRLGREVLDTLVTPMVSGIYSGDPEKLSIQSIFPQIVALEKQYGSIFKGMKHLKEKLKSGTMVSLRSGIGALPQSIANNLGDKIITSARVKNIYRKEGGWGVDFEHHGLRQSIDSKKVVLATPAHVTKSLIASHMSELSGVLGAIPYVSLAVVHTVFKKEDIERPLNGFGYLVPRGQGVRMLGSIWSSSLFRDRAPEGYYLLTNFMGGALDPDASYLSDEEMSEMVLTDLKKTIGIRSKPQKIKVTRYEAAIPQYYLGHEKKLHAIAQVLLKIPGVYLTGSYFTGVSVSDTIEHANRLSQEICS